MKMTIQELRNYAIVCSRTDARMAIRVRDKLVALGEKIAGYENFSEPRDRVFMFSSLYNDWDTRPKKFSAHQLAISGEGFLLMSFGPPAPWPESKPPFPASGRYPTVDPKAPK